MRPFFLTLALASLLFVPAHPQQPQPNSGQVPATGGEAVEVAQIEPGEGAADATPAAEEPEAPAATGTIVGEVYSEEDGFDIADAAVAVEQVDKSTLTEEGGDFRVDGLEPGTYSLSVVSEFFELKKLENIEVRAGQVTKVRVPMVEKQVELDENLVELEPLLVEVEISETGEIIVNIKRQDSPTLGNFMSGDAMRRADVGNVADAVTKTPGANIVDGKYAVIRGLADRYSNTTLNGASIPSADPSKKAVQLDLIPTDLLERLEVTKTFTPDQPGDFTGGNVDIITAEFPEEFTLSVKGGLGYNTQATGEIIRGIPGRDMNFLGQTDDGFPEGAAGVRASTGSPRDPLTPAEAREQMLLLHQFSMFPDGKRADPNTSVGINFGNSWDTRFGKVGVVAGFTQDHGYSYRPDSRVNRSSTASGFLQREIGYDHVDVSAEEITWGALGGLSLQPWEDHTFRMTYLTNNASTDKVTYGDYGYDVESATRIPRGGEDVEFEGDPASAYFSIYQLEHLERSLDSFQIAGDHEFKELRDIKLEWTGTFSEAVEDRPIDRSLRHVHVIFDDPTLDDRRTIVLDNQPLSPRRRFLRTEETRDNWISHLTIPVSLPWQDKTSLKTGFYTSSTDRIVRGRTFGYDLRPGNTWDPATPGNAADITEGFDDPDHISGERRGLYLVDQTRSGNDVLNSDGTERIDAHYFMIDNRANDNWRVVGGVRFESSEMEVGVVPELVNPALGDKQGSFEEEDLLPALSVIRTFNFEDDRTANLIFAYGKTVARPTFYEFAPILTVDQATSEQTEGNPDLERTLVDNYDLRLDFYPSPDEILSIGFFYKDFRMPIVSTVEAVSAGKFRQSWTNAEAGELWGVELEARRRLFPNRELSERWAFLKRFTIGGNLTYIDSKISEIVDGNGNVVGSGTVFEGQPELIGNLMLSYDDYDRNLSANLLYNYVSDILTNVSVGNVPNIFHDDVGTLDFNISKSWFLREDRYKFTLKFSAKNLLNPTFLKYYEDSNHIYEEYRKGRTFGISGSLAF